MNTKAQQLSQEIEVRYSDMDLDKNLKMTSVLSFFQDIATASAEKLGFGHSYTFPKKMMWVLLKYRIEIKEYPTERAKLTLITEPRGCNKFFAFRNFQLFEQNRLIAQASSTWALVNFETMEIIGVENACAEVPTMQKFVPNETDLKYDKIPPLTQTDYEETFTVRYADLDINHHANNTRYIEWALEPLPYEYKRQHKLKNVDIVYKKEIKYGEKLVSKVQMVDEKTTVHVVQNAENGQDLCYLKCEW